MGHVCISHSSESFGQEFEIKQNIYYISVKFSYTTLKSCNLNNILKCENDILR